MKPTKSSIVLLIFIVFLTFCNSTIAKELDIDKYEEKCCAENYSTAGMLKCTQEAYKMWDKELNKYYGLLIQKLSIEERKQLKEAQISWLNYRDKEFKNIDSLNNKLTGTMYINVAAGQKREVVKQRALQIKEYYDNLTK